MALSSADCARGSCGARLLRRASDKEAVKQYEDELSDHGVAVTIRRSIRGVVCAIGNDLYMDYTVVGWTASMAARLERWHSPVPFLQPPTRFSGGAMLRKGPRSRAVRGADRYKSTKSRVRAPRGLARSRRGTWFNASSAAISVQQLSRSSNLPARSRRVAAIVGEAGVGKSRLREFLNCKHNGLAGSESAALWSGNALLADHRAAQGLFQDKRPTQRSIHP